MNSIKENIVIVPFSEIDMQDDFNSDCGGYGFEWKCPDCKETIRWAPSAWWRMDCKCRRWDLKIEAVGELFPEGYK